jgi:hypothetical protein
MHELLCPRDALGHESKGVARQGLVVPKMSRVVEDPVKTLEH